MYRRVLGNLPALVLLVLLPTTAHAVTTGPKGESFSPQGTVKGMRQAVARFSEPMAPFGDRDSASPSPSTARKRAKDAGRMRGHFVYDFERDLPAGVRCTFTLKPKLRTWTASA